MGASQVSGMKMRNLLFGLILGLLAVVHSTPVDTVTQIPAKAEDDVRREAVTDGFLVESLFTPSRTTKSSKLDDMIEGSGDDVNSTTSIFPKFASTTPHVSHAQNSTSTALPRDTDSSSSHSSTTQSPQSTSTSSLVPNEAQPSVTPDHISHSQTTDPSSSTFGFLSTHSSDSGSGDGEMFGHYSSTTSSMTSSSSTETSTASSTSTAASVRPKAPVTFPVNEGSGSGSGSGSGGELGSGMYSSTVSTTTEMPEKHVDIENPIDTILNEISPRLHSGRERSGAASGSGMPSATEETTLKPPVADEVHHHPTEPTNKGHSTPGWIIIVGFVVGVAALVMLCVAIATRDKWNGPSKASQLVAKTNSSNQQRGLEMETFLHKDQPRENGKAAEYTVIPLDELPEKCSSH